ncbi:MAG: tetratricopeptide repeat protein [Acidobacteria bacterium]|nr:tetratricopeptide repeat protein [Acidobacteriota bacterium]
MMNKYFRAIGAAVAASAALLAQQSAPKADKAAAYYNFSMAHLYSELASAFGNRAEYLNKAIEHYRAAIKADPEAGFLSEELSELYIQSGQIRSAITESEEALRRNPRDLSARRVLGRIFTRMIGDARENKVNEEMLKKALEQYQKIAEQEPNDADTWVMLGRLHKIGQSSSESMKAYEKAIALDAENEDALTGLAMVYADLGDSKRASEMLKKVADKSPNLRTLVTLASTYEQAREYALAAETLKRALGMNPGNPEMKRAYAQNALLADRFEEALEAYKELAEEMPRDVQIQLRLSQIYRQLKNWPEAQQAATRAKELDPRNIEIRYNEVNLLEAQGKPGEAVSLLKSIVDDTARMSYSQGERSNRVVLLERLGVLYRQNDQPREAAETFRQIEQLDSSTGPRAAAQVVETWRQAKDYPKAIEESEAAVKKYPDDRMVRLIRANLLAETGKADQGAAEVKKLLDGKNDRDTYISLAQIYEKGRNYDEMARAIDAADKLSTSNDEKEGILFMRGAMLEKQKKFEAAEAQFRKLLEINPDNSSALNYLGYMLADRNVKVDEALKMIQKALGKEPGNGAYLDSLGWAYFRLSKLDEAEKHLKEAIEKAPKDPTVHDHLGDVYARQGRLKDAVTQWQRSVEEWKANAPADQDSSEVAKVQKKLDGARVKLAREQRSAKP